MVILPQLLPALQPVWTTAGWAGRLLVLRPSLKTPLIPSESKGGSNPPSSTSQSAASCSLLTSPSLLFASPLRGPSRTRQYKNRQNKDGKTVDKEQELKCSRVEGWGGYINFSGTDARGLPSNLFTMGGTRLGCSSSSSSSGCLSSLCCFPSRDSSGVLAGSIDSSRVALPQPASEPPSTRLSSPCRCCLPSVCLCRDYEKTQG